MKVSDILHEGQLFQVEENTYRPDLNGQLRTVTMTGAGVLDYFTDDGEVGHTSGLRFRENGDGTYTSPLARRRGHSLTIRPIRPED